MTRPGNRTAEARAAFRALHLLHHEEPKVFDDAIAFHFLGPRWRQLIANRWAYRALNAPLLLSWANLLCGHEIARARYAEERLEAAIARGVDQVVLLGAGMDTLSIRRADLADKIRIYELDDAGTLTLKRRRIAEAGIASPKHTRWVAFDIRSEDQLTDSLLGAGLDPAKPAFITWFGGSWLLERDDALAVFGELAACVSPGSELLFDFGDATRNEAEGDTRAMQRLTAFIESQGETLRTMFDPQELVEELVLMNIHVVETLDAEQVAERWFKGRGDGVRPLPVARLTAARVR